MATTVFQVAAQTLRYPTFDTTGAVTTAGSYAFLADPDDPETAVTTYEELRDGTTTGLLVHQHDGYGASQAALYDAVETGDLVEWRQAPDCFVRYQVTAVKADPTGTVPQKLLGVEWMTYAYEGCRGGPINTRHAAILDFGDLPILGGTSLTTPIVHGIYEIRPEGSIAWEAEWTPWEPLEGWNEPASGWIRDLERARQLLHWREPKLPSGWSLIEVYAKDHVGGGYTAYYGIPGQGIGLEIVIHGTIDRRTPDDAVWRPPGADMGIHEARVITGRPASFARSGEENPEWLFSADVWLYDPATRTEYILYPKSTLLLGPNYPLMLEIAASLFEPPNPP